MITFFEQKVYNAVRRIPKGRVSTYAIVAKKIGNPKAARAVGNALNKNPFAPASTREAKSNRGEPKVPCHRVVRSDGSVGGFAGGTKKKILMLKEEGIDIRSGKVSELNKYLINAK